jgi:hypothetical protein
MVIVCLRTVTVPAHERSRFLDWIAENRDLRERDSEPRAAWRS